MQIGQTGILFNQIPNLVVVVVVVVVLVLVLVLVLVVVSTNNWQTLQRF